MVATPSRTQSITLHMNKKTMQPNYQNRLEVWIRRAHGTPLENKDRCKRFAGSKIDKYGDVVVMSEVPSHQKDKTEDYGEELQDSTDKEKDNINLNRRITKDLKSLHGLRWIEHR